MTEIRTFAREPDEILPPTEPCSTCNDDGGCSDGCCECPDCGLC